MHKVGCHWFYQQKTKLYSCICVPIHLCKIFMQVGVMEILTIEHWIEWVLTFKGREISYFLNHLLHHSLFRAHLCEFPKVVVPVGIPTLLLVMIMGHLRYQVMCVCVCFFVFVCKCSVFITDIHVYTCTQ